MPNVSFGKSIRVTNAAAANEEQNEGAASELGRVKSTEHRNTENLYKAVPRFGEFCSCFCFPLLPKHACSILATWEWPYRDSLYKPRLGLQTCLLYIAEKSNSHLRSLWTVVCNHFRLKKKHWTDQNKVGRRGKERRQFFQSILLCEKAQGKMRPWRLTDQNVTSTFADY